MKTIKIIIQVLITIIPFMLNTIIYVYYIKQSANDIVCIWNIIIAFYLLGQFSNYSHKFGKWFDSKLK
jgi:hypothetical protein